MAKVASGFGVALYYSTDISVFKLMDITVSRVEDIPHNPLVISTPKNLKLTDGHNQLIQYIVSNLANGN